MTPFPKAFVEGIVLLSLVLSGSGVTGLLILLLRDIKAGKLW